jgi:putative sigma-54 modulation protein
MTNDKENHPMRYVFTGKNMNMTDALKNRTKEKLDRIERLLPDDSEAHVTFTSVKSITKIEVSIQLHKRILRAEVSGHDLAGCLDSMVDILERQTVKYKSRLRERSRRNKATNDEIEFIVQQAPDAGTEPDTSIIRTKRFALKPMDAQEAVMEMEMLDHSFYVFRNSDTDEVNVVYKRKDGEYGLIEPLY